MHSLATRVHINTPSRWVEAHKGANSARRIFFGSQVSRGAKPGKSL